MKNNFIKYYISAIYLCTSFAMFAQDPGSGTNGGGTLDDATGDVTPGAPIDGYVWVLALIGLTFVFLRLRAYNKQLNSN